jgi:hypothetical protein
VLASSRSLLERTRNCESRSGSCTVLTSFLGCLKDTSKSACVRLNSWSSLRPGHPSVFHILVHGMSSHPPPSLQLRSLKVILYTSIFSHLPLPIQSIMRSCRFYLCKISNLPVSHHLWGLHPSPVCHCFLPGLRPSNQCVSHGFSLQCAQQHSQNVNLMRSPLCMKLFT